MADRALFESIQNHLEPHIHVKALDLTINDPAFAQIAAETLLTNIREHERLIPPEKHKTGT